MNKEAVIRILVLLFSTTQSDQTIKSTQFRRFYNGYRFQLLSDYHLFSKPAKSTLDCAKNCILSECRNFVYIASNNTCQHYGLWKSNLTIQSSITSTITSYMEKNYDGWIKVYFLKAASNCLPIYTLIQPDFEYIRNCYQKLGSDFFRSPLLDNWNILPLKQVKLVIYKNNKAAVTMVFNGQSSTLSNVFSINRLISSPWTDLVPTNVDVFGLNVWPPRKFYFAKIHKSCNADYGWLLVAEKSLCYFESAFTYPKIMYSKTSIATNWNTDYEIADSLEIYISLL